MTQRFQSMAVRFGLALFYAGGSWSQCKQEGGRLLPISVALIHQGLKAAHANRDGATAKSV